MELGAGRGAGELADAGVPSSDAAEAETSTEGEGWWVGLDDMDGEPVRGGVTRGEELPDLTSAGATLRLLAGDTALPEGVVCELLGPTDCLVRGESRDGARLAGVVESLLDGGVGLLGPSDDFCKRV